MKANDEAEKDSGTRAGGDVVVKSASQIPQPEQRSGYDVATKGQSHKADDGTRAGGDVVIKSASQREQDESATPAKKDS